MKRMESMESSVVFLSAANRVFGCRDLRRQIAQFLPWYCVNPLFGSLEGAILENRPELYGTPGFETLSDERIVRFIRHYAETYEDHRDISDFSTCLNYVCTRVGLCQRNIDMFDRMAVGHFMELLCIKLIESTDRPRSASRILEWVKGMLQTRLDYSFRDIFEIWIDNSKDHRVGILAQALKVELDSIMESDNNENDSNWIHHSVDYLDERFRYCIQDLISRYVNMDGALILMDIRMCPSYFYMGVRRDFSEPFAKLVQYASSNCVDIFTEYGIYLYVEDCIECIESLNTTELQVIINDEFLYDNLYRMMYSSLDFMRQHWMGNLHLPNRRESDLVLAERLSHQLQLIASL